MRKLDIICIINQQEDLKNLMADLTSLEKYVSLKSCQTATEAQEMLENLDGQGLIPALIISNYNIPEKNGLNFLTEISHDTRFKDTQKILLSDLVSEEEVHNAINNAHVNYLFKQNYNKDLFIEKIKRSLTRFVIAKSIDYKQFLEILDQPMLFEALKKNI